MSTKYLLDQDNENLAITLGFEKLLTLVLNGFPSDDITADAVNFDIGIEGEDALISGAAAIIEPLSPQKITLTIPPATFTKPQKRLILQLRWTPSGGNERLVSKNFIDVRNPVNTI